MQNQDKTHTLLFQDSVKDVFLYVFDGMSDWEAAYAIAGINSPEYQKNPGNYRVRTVALSKTPVMTAGGICIHPNQVFGELSLTHSAMLILPGGQSWNDKNKHLEALDMTEKFLNAEVFVAAICGATTGLAQRGLLNARRHTSNSRDYLSMTPEYSGIKFYEDNPAVTDKGLITASAMAAVDFAYHIFQHLDIYSQAVLNSWYQLFKTGRAEYFLEMMKAASV